MLYSKENYETYFGIVKTLQSMDGNATYDEILEEEEGNLRSSILIIKESLTNLIEEIGEEEAIDYVPVLERVEAFMEDNEIEESFHFSYTLLKKEFKNSIYYILTKENSI